jgi:putative MATE family efflux protein
MTSGKPLPIILRFSLPMVVGSVIQQLYSVVDMLVVGNVIGSRALASIGASMAASFLAWAVVIGMTTGFTAVVARHYGSNDTASLKKAVAAAVYISIGMTLVMIAMGWFAVQPLLILLNTPSDILSDAVTYIRIILVGGVGMVFYQSCSAILRAVGDSRTPLIFLIIASVLSLLLNILFIVGMGMGVAGAAIGTVIAQCFSAAACMVYMVKRFDIFRLEKSDWRIHRKTLTDILKIGLPVVLQTMLLSVGDMTILRVVNSFGCSDIVAAYAVAGRIMMTVMMFGMNLAMAYSVFAAQNLGAGCFERIHSGFRDTIKIMLAMSAVMTAMVFMFGDAWVRFFIADADAHIEAVITISRVAMRVPALFYVFLGAIWLYNYTLRGMGDVVIPFVSGMLELVCKVGLSVVFAFLFGYVGVWFAMPVGWVIGVIPSVVRFHGGKWERANEKAS